MPSELTLLSSYVVESVTPQLECEQTHKKEGKPKVYIKLFIKYSAFTVQLNFLRERLFCIYTTHTTFFVLYLPFNRSSDI